MPLAQSDLDQWISLSEDPVSPDLFFLGAVDNRITFYSQQVRALRVVHALRMGKRLTNEDRVAIIGAGAAGVTAALACALLGCRVDLFEKATDILSLQSGSPRLLHPHIYDWPLRGSLQSYAVLPILDWEAGQGRIVRDRLAADFSAARACGVHLNVRTHWELKELRRGDDEWELCFIDENKEEQPRNFSKVFLAIGFGEEAECGAAPKIDYWRHPGLGSSLVEIEAAHYFVSGSGDGGLTDMLAVLIRDFEHVTFTSSFLGLVRRAELAKAVQDAEAEIDADGADLWPSYERHVLPVLHKRGLIDHVAAQLRKDRTLLFNAKPVLAKSKAARLNQVMVSALMAAAKTKPGLLRFSTGLVRDVTVNCGQYTVTGPEEGGRALNETFDAVVLRHGPAKVTRYAPATAAYCSYKAHHESLIAKHSDWADPPQLAPETFEFFDKLFTDRSVDLNSQASRRAEAGRRPRTLLLSWDAAHHEVVQQGAADLLTVATTIDSLSQPLIVMLALPPEKLVRYDDIIGRLVQASAGRVTREATAPFLQDWRKKYVDISGPTAYRSPYPLLELPEPESLWDALDHCLLRQLDARLDEVVSSGQCTGFGHIDPTITATFSETWRSWRTVIDAAPALRADFLRLLYKVEPAGTDRWSGEPSCLPEMLAALVLMLATHAGQPLLPASCLPGNVQFGSSAVGLGSGCRFINGVPISDFEDAEAWDVDALILSGASGDMFEAPGGIIDGGTPSRSLTRPRRVAPVVIPNTKRWRQLLGTDLARWQEGVGAEFEKWRKRQDETLGEA